MKAVRFFAVFFAILLATLLLAAGASADVLRLPDGVKIIETEAFRGDTSLDEVVLPEGIERIESGAFAYSSVKSVNLPDSLVSIDSTAFEGVQGLSVTAKAGTVGYEWAVAQGYIEGEEWISSPVENFTFNALSDTTCEVTGYNGNDTDIVIPRIDSDGKTVVQIGAFAFSGNKTLMSVCIPATVNSIQDHAFRSCSSLMSIIIPDGVSSIGSSAFYSCTSLTNITFPDSMASIYDSTFNGCTSLKSFNVSAGNTVFASLDGILTNKNMTMIYRCPQAKEGPISIPNGIIGISNYAFCDCIKVTSIAIPDGVTNIGNRAFYNCTGLTSINIPDGVTNIGSNAFYCCKGLISITIPKGVTCINGYTFYECTKLTSVILPDGVVSIGDEAFYHCTELRDISISDAVTDIGSYAFCGCKALTGITIPANLTTIGQGAFSGCSGLTGSIILPDGVNSIPNYAFSNCSGLTDITIPESVQYISKSAFTNTNEQLQFIVTPGSYAETWLITNGYIKSAPEIASVEFSATEIHYTDGDQYSFLALTGSYNLKANAKSNIECHWYISDTPDFEDAEEYGSYYGDVHYPMSFTDYPFGTEFHYGGAQYADTWYVWVQAQNDYGTTMVGPFATEKTDAYTSMYVTLTGLVTTEDGTPIPGVRVYYFDEDISTYTDGEGRWTFEHWDRRPEGQIVCFTHPDYHFELESFECGYFSTVEEHPTVIGYPVELTGSFDDDYVELEPGEIMQVAGSVTSGGSYHNYLGRVSLTIDGYHVEDDDSDRYVSHDFQYDYVRMISLADYEVFKLDTTKEPLNVPGTYTVQLWAATAGDDNGRILDSMTVIVGESTSSLHGLVQTPAGSPIDGAYVIGVNTDNEKDYFFVRTGSNGQWSASELTAGATYELSAYHPDYDFGEAVAVTPDEETHVLIGALPGAGEANISFTMRQNGAVVSEIWVGTAVDFVVTAPGMQYVRLVVDGKAYEYYPVQEDGTAVFSRVFSSVGNGTRHIRIQGFTEDEGWSVLSEEQMDLKVSFIGSLEAPKLPGNMSLIIGNDLTVLWEAVQHASSYTVYVYSPEGVQLWPKSDNINPSVSGLSDIVPADVFTISGVFSLQVVATGVGYDSATGVTTLKVTETGAEAAILSPEEGSIIGLHDVCNIYVASNIDVETWTVSIVPDHPDDQYSGETMDIDNNGYSKTQFDRADGYTLTAYATVGNSIYTSNSVHITVPDPVVQLNCNSYSYYCWQLEGSEVEYRVTTNFTPYMVTVQNGDFRKEIKPESDHLYQFKVFLTESDKKEEYVFTVTDYNGKEYGPYSIPVFVMTSNENKGKTVYTTKQTPLYTHPEKVSSVQLPAGTRLTVLQGKYNNSFTLVRYNGREYFAKLSDVSLSLPDTQRVITDVTSTLDDEFVTFTNQEVGFTIQTNRIVDNVDVIVKYLAAAYFDKPEGTGLVEWPAESCTKDPSNPSLFTCNLTFDQAGMYSVYFKPSMSDNSGEEFYTYNYYTITSVEKSTSGMIRYLKDEETSRIYQLPNYTGVMGEVDYTTPLHVEGFIGEDIYYVKCKDVIGYEIGGFIDSNITYIRINKVEKRAYIMFGKTFGKGDGVEDEDDPHIQFAAVDSAEIERFFLRVGCDVVVNNLATTLEKANEYLELARKSADFNDITYIYLAGHGNSEGKGLEFAEGEMMTMSYFAEEISQINGHVNVFLDSCFNGYYLVDDYLETQYELIHGSRLNEDRFSIITNGGKWVTLVGQGGTRWIDVTGMILCKSFFSVEEITLGKFYKTAKNPMNVRTWYPETFFQQLLADPLDEVLTWINPPLKYGNDENILFDLRKS